MISCCTSPKQCEGVQNSTKGKKNISETSPRHIAKVQNCFKAKKSTLSTQFSTQNIKWRDFLTAKAARDEHIKKTAHHVIVMLKQMRMYYMKITNILQEQLSTHSATWLLRRVYFDRTLFTASRLISRKKDNSTAWFVNHTNNKLRHIQSKQGNKKKIHEYWNETEKKAWRNNNDDKRQ